MPIKTYVNEGNVYASLEVCEYSDRTAFHLLALERKKKELFICQEETLSEIEQVSKRIKKGFPLFLVINTSKVLVKILPLTAETNQEALVHNAFPNLEFNDFYYELVRTKMNLIISICRKKHVAEYLKVLTEQQLSVVQVFLGIATISTSLAYLPSGALSLSNTDITLSEEGTLKSIRPLTTELTEELTTYKINGLELKGSSLLGFSSILGHLQKSIAYEGNLEQTKAELSTEFTNKRHFKLLFQSALTLVLGILLINFIVFSYYFEQVETLEEILAVNNANKESLLRLNDDVQRKENRLKAVLAMSNSSTSAMLDALAKDLPTSILLDDIQYQWLRRPLREAKAVELENNMLRVSGAASSSTDFYDWIAHLETLSWIQSVETTDYDYGTRNTSNFTIQIVLHE